MANLDIIKSLIERMKTVETIISILVSLLFSVFINNDIVWVAICFFSCYLIVLCIEKLALYYKLKNAEKRYLKQQSQRSEEEEYAIRECNTIYESLSGDNKRILMDLYRYKKLEGGFENQRNLPLGIRLNGEVSSVCYQLNNTFWNLELLQLINSTGSTIVVINRYFYEVLKEKSETFEM